MNIATGTDIDARKFSNGSGYVCVHERLSSWKDRKRLVLSSMKAAYFRET